MQSACSGPRQAPDCFYVQNMNDYPGRKSAHRSECDYTRQDCCERDRNEGQSEDRWVTRRNAIIFLGAAVTTVFRYERRGYRDDRMGTIPPVINKFSSGNVSCSDFFSFIYSDFFLVSSLILFSEQRAVARPRICGQVREDGYSWRRTVYPRSSVVLLQIFGRAKVFFFAFSCSFLVLNS